MAVAARQNGQVVMLHGSDNKAAWEAGYKTGAIEAFEALKKIILMPEDGGLSNREMSEIFGKDWEQDAILKESKILDIIDKVQEHEERVYAIEQVTKLADQIGIHKLYSLVREMRGE